jgi:CheY-like chemotaxis protein
METAGIPKYRRVMVVDDNKIDRYVIEMVIKKSNFASEVIQVDSGFEALKYLESKLTDKAGWPDMMLLDINMPGMNGFEFLEKFIALTEDMVNACDIYMLTTSIHPSDIDKAIHHKHIVKFINKPLNIVKLREIMPKL